MYTIRYAKKGYKSTCEYTMSIVKQIAMEQYRNRVNKVAAQMRTLELPKEGWLSTVRKALGISVAQLARRLGVTRAQVYKTEKAELSGRVTIKTMQSMAEGMGCRFVYTIVPHDTVENILAERAKKKAQRMVEAASRHAALEDQVLTEQQIEFEIERLQRDMLKDIPSDFWNDEV